VNGPTAVEDAWPYNRGWLTYASRNWLPRAGEGGLVLDLGCGIGVNGRILRDLGHGTVVGIDNDWGCLRAASSRGLGTAAASLLRPLPFRNASVDLVLLVHVIEHIRDGISLLSEVFRVLRVDGRVVVVTPNWRKVWRRFYDDPTHVHPYTPTGLASALESAGFEVTHRTGHNVGWKLGRTRLWEVFPRLCFTGDAIFAVGRKRVEP
jgi:SAM-dependent methyltransferase